MGVMIGIIIGGFFGYGVGYVLGHDYGYVKGRKDERREWWQMRRNENDQSNIPAD